MDAYKTFLNEIFNQINLIGIDVDGYDLDHIAYQASSIEDYEKHKVEYSGIGDFFSEEIVGERRVAIYKLTTAIQYKKYSIPALEIIEPKEGQVIKSGFQHAEFVMPHPFENYIEKYPTIQWDKSSMYRDEFAHLKLNFKNGLTLKFLRKPILEMARSNQER
jgi:predicted metalloenzyme YecM